MTSLRLVEHNIDPGIFYVISIDNVKKVATVEKVCSCPFGRPCRCLVRDIRKYSFGELRYA